MNVYGNGYGSEAVVQQDYIKTLLATFKRRALTIVSYSLLLAGILAVAIQFLPRTYRATASVEVMTKTVSVANPDVLTGDTAFTDETAGTEVAIFESHELRTAVIDKLELLRNPEFNPDLAPSRWSKMLATGEAYIRQTPWLNAIVPPDWLPATVISTGQALADTVEMLGKKAVAQPVSHSKIIQVAAFSHDPQLAAQIANAMVAEYVAVHQRQKINASHDAYEYTREHLPALEAEMRAKNALVDQFRQQNHMVSGQYAAIKRERMSSASAQLVDAQNKLAALKAQAVEARVGDVLNNPAVLASPTVQRLREQQSAVMVEGVGKTFGSEIRAKERSDAIAAQIRAEAVRIVNSLPGQVAAQEAAVRSQQAAFEAIQREVSEMDRLESALAPLENDAKLATGQYNAFRSSDNTTRPDVVYTGVPVRLLSAAAVPYRPFFPNNGLMIPAVMVLCFGGVTAATLYRNRRIGFTSTLQFRDTFQMAPIGRVPFRSKSMEAAYWDALMALSFRLLPPFGVDQTGRKHTFLVTSAQPHEGKTTIAAGLAEVFAERAVSVILVDADLRVIRSRKGPPPQGLGELLRRNARLEDVVITRQGVAMIPAGAARAGNPSALIASDHMMHLMGQLQVTYDIVIIDAPPAPIGGDVYALSRLATRILFVVKQGGTGEREVEDAFGSVAKDPADIGVILNMIRTSGDADDELAFSAPMMTYYHSKGNRFHDDA